MIYAALNCLRVFLKNPVPGCVKLCGQYGNLRYLVLNVLKGKLSGRKKKKK